MVRAAVAAMALALSAFASAGVIVEQDRAVANDTVRVEVANSSTIRVSVQGDRLAGIHLGPRGAITAGRVRTRSAGASATLELADLRCAENAVGLSGDSRIAFTIADASPWPRVRFDLGIESFDEAAWQRVAGGSVPFHFLLCELAGATMHYQGGGLIPTPDVDPFPITAKGPMAGNWADGWSYAPALSGWAVPAVGQWNHRAGRFVAYDFSEARHTDRSSRLVACAFNLNEGGEPYACLVHPYQRNWVDLTWPEAPSRTASHFEFIYDLKMPDSRDPNRFVLERFWRERQHLLNPVPAMNDMAWIPEYDSGAPGGGVEPTALGAQLRWLSSPRGLEGAFVEVGTTMLGNSFISDGVLRARVTEDTESLARLRDDLDYILPRCQWLDIDGDRCATWVHPAEGVFLERWGGERCAGHHHPSTFQIGAGALLQYEMTGDTDLLPYIDGVYNWCKHYLFTRNGVCDLPWAEFCRVGTAAGENFLLNYRRVFRENPVRSRNHEEALDLALTSLYKVLWFYTADPDLTDHLDPTFLNQAVNDSRWIGRVTWNECGWVLRTMVPLYCDTGDPLLKYLLRGALERYYAGFRADKGVAENLQIFGEIEEVGLRTAGMNDALHGGNVRRWARPCEPAKLRVAVGERAAIAFGLGTREYDITAYRYRSEANFAFTLTGPADRREPIDIVVTAPFRDLKGKTVAVNGEILPTGRYESNWATDGEDVYIAGVRPGDVIQIGEPADAPVLPAPPIPTRAVEPHADDAWQCARVIEGGPLNVAWWEDDSWAGLVPGTRHVWGIPFTLTGETATSLQLPDPCSTLFAVFGRLNSNASDSQPVGKLRIALANGEARTLTVHEDLPIDLCNGFPLRQFETFIGVLDLGPGPARVTDIAVEDGALLALTAGRPGSEPAQLAVARVDALRPARQAARAFTHYQSPTETCPEDRPWARPDCPYRFRLRALPSPVVREDVVLRACEDFEMLLSQVGIDAGLDDFSVRVHEVGSGPVPAQFDPVSQDERQRGELLVLLPGVTRPGQARDLDVYIGPAVASRPVVEPFLSDGQVRVDTGPQGARFEFTLDGEGPGPRWTHLSFAGGDNVLGPSGWHGGGAMLTVCTDRVVWYDNGGLQSGNATAETISAGPVATTVRVSSLELWGRGEEQRLLETAEGEVWAAGRVGVADWYFRFTTGKPTVEQWVDVRLDRLDHSWTRPLQVRYGLAQPELGHNAVVGGVKVGQAEGLMSVPLPLRASTIEPLCQYTLDGPVLQTLFVLPDALGHYFTGRWLVAPRGPKEDRLVADAQGHAVEQCAMETLVAGRVVAREPTRMSPVLYDRTAGRGPTPTPPRRPVVVAEDALNTDPSFEGRERFWAMGHGDSAAAWTEAHARSGDVALDLSCEKSGLSLAQTNGPGSRKLAAQPNAVYEVTFQAKCTSGDGQVHVNFFATPGRYDFPHSITSVPADSQWHQIRVEVPTGDFDAIGAEGGHFSRRRGIAPALRLWTIDREQRTYVDDVTVRRLR